VLSFFGQVSLCFCSFLLVSFFPFCFLFVFSFVYLGWVVVSKFYSPDGWPLTTFDAVGCSWVWSWCFLQRRRCRVLEDFKPLSLHLVPPTQMSVPFLMRLATLSYESLFSVSSVVEKWWLCGCFFFFFVWLFLWAFDLSSLSPFFPLWPVDWSCQFFISYPFFFRSRLQFFLALVFLWFSALRSVWAATTLVPANYHSPRRLVSPWRSSATPYSYFPLTPNSFPPPHNSFSLTVTFSFSSSKGETEEKGPKVLPTPFPKLVHITRHLLQRK